MTSALRSIEGKYEILAQISEGGMGAIYKVRHRLLDEIRVVKTLRPQLVGDAELAARFLREAQVAIKLRHRNIAELYDFALDDDGIAYIVMEYIPGQTLEELLSASGPPPLPLTLEIARQALTALDFLHLRGYLHRDISPDNVMLSAGADGDPRVKIIDLGIAKVLAGTTENLTATGMFVGKLRYSSPEQFGSVEAGGTVTLDARSDVYSFGVVLYELLTGTYPIIGEETPALVAGHLFHPPRSFDETDPRGRVPEDLRAIVHQALAKGVAQRIADAATFGQRLRVVQERYQLTGRELERTLPLPLPLPLPVDGDGVADGDEDEVASRDGSTQARLNRQFGARTTPPPSVRVEAGAARAAQRKAEAAPTTVPTVAKTAVLSRRAAKPKRWLGGGLRRRGLRAFLASALVASLAVLAPPSRSARLVAPDPGWLMIDAGPWAEIIAVVDRAGRDFMPRTEPFTPRRWSVPPGNYEIRLRRPNAVTEAHTVVVRPGATAWVVGSSTDADVDADADADSLLRQLGL